MASTRWGQAKGPSVSTGGGGGGPAIPSTFAFVETYAGLQAALAGGASRILTSKSIAIPAGASLIPSAGACKVSGPMMTMSTSVTLGDLLTLDLLVAIGTATMTFTTNGATIREITTAGTQLTISLSGNTDSLYFGGLAGNIVLDPTYANLFYQNAELAVSSSIQARFNGVASDQYVFLCTIVSPVADGSQDYVAVVRYDSTQSVTVRVGGSGGAVPSLEVLGHSKLAAATAASITEIIVSGNGLWARVGGYPMSLEVILFAEGNQQIARGPLFLGYMTSHAAAPSGPTTVGVVLTAGTPYQLLLPASLKRTGPSTIATDPASTLTTKDYLLAQIAAIGTGPLITVRTEAELRAALALGTANKSIWVDNPVTLDASNGAFPDALGSSIVYGWPVTLTGSMFIGFSSVVAHSVRWFADLTFATSLNIGLYVAGSAWYARTVAAPVGGIMLTGGAPSVSFTYERITTGSVTGSNNMVVNKAAWDNTGVLSVNGSQGIVSVTPASIGAIPVSQNTLTKEPTGWDNPANVDIAYDMGNRRVTVNAISGTASLYWRGTAVLTVTAGVPWNSAQHAVTTGLAYYLYYDGVSFSFGDLVKEVTPWRFDYAMVAFCYYGAADRWGIREPHGLNLPETAHREDHFNIGTWRQTGATNYGAVTWPGAFGSTVPANRRPVIAACDLWDEDVPTTNAAQSSAYCLLFLAGAGAISTFQENNLDIVPLTGVGGRACWNNPNGGGPGIWTNTALASNEYTPVFTVEVPVTSDATSQAFRVLQVTGQAAYATAALAQAVEFFSLNLGTFFNIAPEWLATQRTVVRGNNANDQWSITSSQQLVGTRFQQVSVASSGMTNPMTTTGDLIVAANTAVPATPDRLAAGAAGTVLTGNGAGVLPSWQTPSAGGGKAQTMTFYENAAIGALTRIRPLGSDGTYTVVGIPVLNSGTIRKFACISHGASSAGTMAVRINGGADQTICSLVTSVAPASQSHTTIAIAVNAGDYIELRTDTAAFAFGPYCTLEVS